VETFGKGCSAKVAAPDGGCRMDAKLNDLKAVSRFLIKYSRLYQSTTRCMMLTMMM
jgi:hypothetical protein